MKKVNKEEAEYLRRLGTHIEELRKAKDLTQAELADAIGTQHPQIGRLERGETNASIITLRNIASKLQIPLGKLVTP